MAARKQTETVTLGEAARLWCCLEMDADICEGSDIAEAVWEASQKIADGVRQGYVSPANDGMKSLDVYRRFRTFQLEAAIELLPQNLRSKAPDLLFKLSDIKRYASAIGDKSAFRLPDLRPARAGDDLTEVLRRAYRDLSSRGRATWRDVMTAIDKNKRKYDPNQLVERIDWKSEIVLWEGKTTPFSNVRNRLTGVRKQEFK